MGRVVSDASAAGGGKEGYRRGAGYEIWTMPGHALHQGVAEGFPCGAPSGPMWYQHVVLTAQQHVTVLKTLRM